MNHTKLISALAVATAMLAVAGCGSGGGGSYGGGTGTAPPPSPPPPPPPPPPTGTNFTGFTRDLLVSTTTSETGEPIELETIEWAFPDDDDATTYDDIIAASGP
jgi:hypothetical protein